MQLQALDAKRQDPREAFPRGSGTFPRQAQDQVRANGDVALVRRSNRGFVLREAMPPVDPFQGLVMG